MWAGRTVLITGSAGHLGEALARVLRDAGHDVAGLDVPGSPFTTHKPHVGARARAELGWGPRYDIRYVLGRLKAGEDPRSPLARTIGARGYHVVPTGR